MPRAFKLIQTLGEGSFGAVHLAEVAGDEGFVQRLAVKWLLPQWSHDAELAGRLRDEARLLGLMSHEHIVRVHGLTRIDGRLAILMEPIDGVDLSRLEGTQAPPRASLEIVGDVADALDAAYQTVPPGGTEPLRVVHRDIKPSNVMVSARGSVKVMDFGVARATFEAREAHTRSQQFGTARYMAPERWLEGVSESPSDVFSLGVTLVELVGGRPVERPRLSPEGFAEDIGRALDALAPWPPIRELAARMCAYKPAERPTAAEVCNACHQIASHLPGAGLRDWAPTFLSTHPSLARNNTDGSIVHEDASAETFITGPTERVPTPATAPFRDLLDPLPTAPTAPVAAPPARPGASARWNQAMTTVGIAAITVLAVSAWQYMRASATVPEPTIAAVAAPPPAPPPAPPVADPAPAPAPVELPTPVDPAPTALATTAAIAAPEPTAPRVAPRPKVDPPIVVEVPVVAEPPPVESIVMTFEFDPKLRVTVDGEPVTTHRGVSLPRGKTLTVAVSGGSAPFSCTVRADPSQKLVKIDSAARLCR